MRSPSREDLLISMLADIRRANGLTQVQVAERLSRPQSFVSKYESGERRLDVLEFLDVCAALETDAGKILSAIAAGRT